MDPWIRPVQLILNDLCLCYKGALRLLGPDEGPGLSDQGVTTYEHINRAQHRRKREGKKGGKVSAVRLNESKPEKTKEKKTTEPEKAELLNSRAKKRVKVLELRVRMYLLTGISVPL